jgi:hypothetical protein
MNTDRFFDLGVFVFAAALAAALPAHATPACEPLVFKMTVDSVTIGGVPAMTPPPATPQSWSA